MKISPRILALVAKQYTASSDADECNAILDFVFGNGVEMDWLSDIIHFNIYPIDGERPTIMPKIGRGLEKMNVFSRVDYSSIVLGFNGSEIDYPDLCDVFVESAQCKYTGQELNEKDLDELSDDHALKMEALQ